ncbi:MAG: hypothetical protein COU22_01015 [Candidatus Komeilibacteria bacterium CG10_big_fil_rev_8_21_14_0_10_41_13]|uniref:DUF4134 domain-containing protein n=1 Tax=Candidatus Komeilibacteria bacterium CG10_big_fil_rev_8_21_14_0_10_41_13 TaxID=1974476 RepID=A0A2M6WD23_9BACT|nr:MAG: hypothetical protein COU22_01015 [Candidatus Komeilibacteria bacterium CG10_big_fil_rev_8_21_14_0_10_41_13]
MLMSLKKILILNLTTICLLSLIPATSSAQTPQADNVGDVVGGLNKAAQTSLLIPEKENEQITSYNFIEGALKTFLSIIGVIYLGYIIYGGIVWMVAKGNEKESERAAKILEHSFVGIIIIFLAYLFVNFALFRLLEIITT